MLPSLGGNVRMYVHATGQRRLAQSCIHTTSVVWVGQHGDCAQLQRCSGRWAKWGFAGTVACRRQLHGICDWGV